MDYSSSGNSEMFARWTVPRSREGNGQFGVPKGCVSLHLLTSVPNKNVLYNSLYDLLSKIIGTVFIDSSSFPRLMTERSYKVYVA